MTLNTDPILKLLGLNNLNYEDLTEEEKQHYNMLADAQNEAKITPEGLQREMEELVFSVTLELCNTSSESRHRSKNDRLKARLLNYTLLLERLKRSSKFEEVLKTYNRGNTTSIL